MGGLGVVNKMALMTMNRNKLAEPEVAVVDILSTINNFSTENVTEIINRIDSGDIPEVISWSIFVALLRRLMQINANSIELNEPHNQTYHPNSEHLE